MAVPAAASGTVYRVNISGNIQEGIQKLAGLLSRPCRPISPGCEYQPLPRSLSRAGYWLLVPKSHTASRPVAGLPSPSASSMSTDQGM